MKTLHVLCGSYAPGKRLSFYLLYWHVGVSVDFAVSNCDSDFLKMVVARKVIQISFSVLKFAESEGAENNLGTV